MELQRRNVPFWTLLVVFFAASVRAVFIEPLQALTSQRSLAESATRLPCRYQSQVGETVVQVTWYKELRDGTKDQIITAHFSDGQTEFRGYVNRMRFQSDDPIANSALLLPNTDESDDGMYACHISTFPNGNFERRIRLTVWVLPISSLEPVVLVEGQPFRVAASCRAVGRPLPVLSWDTTVPGKSQNRTSNEAGSISSYFSLHPLRSMNGKRLDCLVRHPGLERPRRLSNQIVVHYPPDASITATTDNWFVGLDQAALTCQTSGFPVPEDVTWTWRGGALPEGVAASGARLTFARGLRLNDSGLYQCSVSNGVGVAKADYKLTVTASFLAEKSQRKEPLAIDSSTLIIVVASAGAVVLVMAVVVALLVRHHRRRSQKLKKQLNDKTEQVNTLSREASFKRLNSFSSDPRTQSEDYALLRTDSRMKNSQASMERPVYRDSQSTLGGRWAPLGVSDVDGRPGVWHDEGDDVRVATSDPGMDNLRRRADSYQESSNMSLDSGLPSSVLPMKVQPDDTAVPRTPSDTCDKASPSEDNWCPPPPPPPTAETFADGPDGGEDGDEEPYQLSQALTNHFYYSNGVLRPRPHANAILMHPNGQVI
ncbi:nectin-4 isoform X2 [Stigmatopora nigra]